METISVSKLKSHLSEELKRVQGGLTLTVLDHKRPVAVLKSVTGDDLILREPRYPYNPGKLEPLVSVDPEAYLNIERADSW